MMMLNIDTNALKARMLACFALILSSFCLALPLSAMAQQSSSVVNTSSDGIVWQDSGQGASTPQASVAAEPQSTQPRLTRVALLVPLSGQHAAIGEALLRASQLAVFDLGIQGFEILPKDTGGTPAGARLAAQAALSEGAELILGPVFADSVWAVKSVVQNRVPVVSFSTDWRVAGGNVFIMGFLPYSQVERVLRYSQAAGYSQFGALLPDSDYGKLVGDTINHVMGEFRRLEIPAELTRLQKYPAQNASFDEVMRGFTNSSPTPAMQADSAIPSARLPYQAVLLADGGETAKQLASLLKTYGGSASGVKLLGTGLWDDTALMSDPSLQGAWFAAPDPSLRAGFLSEYKGIFGAEPPRLATLGYDGTALAAALVQAGMQQYGRPAFDVQSLQNPSGFSGVDGIFRFRQDGLVERGLAVMEVRVGGAAVVDAAPTSF